MPILLIIGPSASGKSALLRRLIASYSLVVIPTWTTRPMRDDEADDPEHMYVSDAEFDARTFIATVTPFGVLYRYGLPVFRDNPDQLTVVMVRAPQVAQFKAGFPNAVVYQIQAPYETVTARLAVRDAAQVQGSRLRDYDAEVELGRSLADRTFHNDSSIDALYEKVSTAMMQDFNILS